MADPVDPILDAPPAEPFDVPVFPDTGPAEPFDVPTLADSPSPGPIDVPTFPDASPSAPFDVAVSLDSPPVEPFDVAVLPDAAPAVPFDVPTFPDSAPAAPFDVTVSPDSAPDVPFDVPITPDSGPSTPFDVAVSFDAPPIDPFDVATVADTVPAIPFDVPTQLDTPPYDPITGRNGLGIALDADVLVQRDAPPYVPHDISISGIETILDQLDKTVADHLRSIAGVDNSSFYFAGAGALDPQVLAGWFKNYVGQVGRAGVERFIAEQSVLYAMNPVVARVFNPFYFTEMAVPRSMGYVQTTADTTAGETYDKIVQAFDSGPGTNFVYDENATKAIDSQNAYVGPKGSGQTMDDGQEFDLGQIVDATIDGSSVPFSTPSSEAGIVVNRFDASKFFQPRESSGRQLVKSEIRNVSAGRSNIQQTPLARSAATNGIIPAAIPGEDSDSSVSSKTDDPSTVVDDDDAYVPISFTDLRPISNGSFRSVYFRPMNVHVSENFAVDYSQDNAFGRTDPVLAYASTVRSFDLSFEMHAFAPEDLSVMYGKILWLKSMVYPAYTPDALMRSGPVVRMRVGDLVSAGGKGLPGVIQSLAMDYGDAIWELKKGAKVPRSVTVTISFLALHEGPVGSLNGGFGVLSLPTLTDGNSSPTVTGASIHGTNVTDIGTQQNFAVGSDRVATIVSGKFMGFGEPRKK